MAPAEILDGDAEEGRVLPQPRHLVGVDVPIPDAHPRVAQGQQEPRVTLLQLLLDGPLLGLIPEDQHHAGEAAVLAPDGRGAVDDGALDTVPGQ